MYIIECIRKDEIVNVVPIETVSISKKKKKKTSSCRKLFKLRCNYYESLSLVTCKILLSSPINIHRIRSNRRI
jgi:hypothetical protein